MFHRTPTPACLPRRAWTWILLVASLGLTCPAATGRADVLRILNNHQEAAQARVDLIQQAQFEIDAAYFKVTNDHLALAYLALLRDAAQRGVKVRLIIDALNNRIPDALQTYLVKEGVEIREFHPVRICQPMEINRRMHDKVLIADAGQMIVGGRNLDCRNFGLAKRNYVDCDAYLRGDAAVQAYDYFQCLWNSSEVRPTHERTWPEIRDLHPARFKTQELNSASNHPQFVLEAALFELCASGFVRTNTGGDWAFRQPEPASVRFLSDYRGRKGHSGTISEVILHLVANARDSIIIESPYLVLSPALDSALAQAQARGVCVVILTNSLASTDQILVYGGYSNQKQKLLARGIQLWEFAGPDHFHAKSAVIDGHISIIGAYNFDPRSEQLNTETGVVAWDPIVAALLNESLAEHFANARRIGPDGKPFNSNCRHPGAGQFRICELHGARLVASLIKRQL